MTSLHIFRLTLIFHLIALSSSVYAGVTIIEDFEGSSAGSRDIPAGWSVHEGTYQTTAGGGGCNPTTGGNGGLGGTITSSVSTASNLPTSYLFSETSLSSKDNITGSFNLYIQANNLNDFTFSIGDISNGIGDTTGGNSMTIHLFAEENTGNPMFRLADSDNSTLSSGTMTGAVGWGTWRKMDINWIANGDGSGTFEIAMSDYLGNTNFSTSSSYTFNNEDIQLGFGTTVAGSENTAQFDNINVSSTVVPEPSSSTLLGFFALSLTLKRSRNKKKL
jgi:hypothetical protein